jgi:hypothetical protein
MAYIKQKNKQVHFIIWRSKTRERGPQESSPNNADYQAMFCDNKKWTLQKEGSFKFAYLLRVQFIRHVFFFYNCKLLLETSQFLRISVPVENERISVPIVIMDHRTRNINAKP